MRYSSTLNQLFSHNSPGRRVRISALATREGKWAIRTMSVTASQRPPLPEHCSLVAFSPCTRPLLYVVSHRAPSPLQAILRGARAMGVSVSPSASVLNVVTARAMLPGLATMFASLGAIRVRYHPARLLLAKCPNRHYQSYTLS